jgi:hypothetical protein
VVRPGVRVRGGATDLGEDRVLFLEEDGTLKSLPTGWTDAAAPDVFVAVAAGRSPFRAEDLLGLAELIERARPVNVSDGV